MSPRYRDNCVKLAPAEDSEVKIKIELDQPYYLEYLHSISEPYAESGNCLYSMSNKYFYKEKYSISDIDTDKSNRLGKCDTKNPTDLVDFVNNGNDVLPINIQRPNESLEQI